MDPLSLAATITGLMSFAAAVSVTIVNTIATAKGAKSHLANLAAELDTFQHVLGAVNNELHRSSRVSDNWRQLLRVVVDNSNGCLVELDRKIRKVESQAGDTGSKWSQFKRSRLMVGSKYVYKEGAIVGMTNRLDRCRSMMQIILAGISSESNNRMENRLDDLHVMVSRALMQAPEVPDGLPPAYSVEGAEYLERTASAPQLSSPGPSPETSEQESGTFSYLYEALSGWMGTFTNQVPVIEEPLSYTISNEQKSPSIHISQGSENPPYRAKTYPQTSWEKEPQTYSTEQPPAPTENRSYGGTSRQDLLKLSTYDSGMDHLHERSRSVSDFGIIKKPSKNSLQSRSRSNSWLSGSPGLQIKSVTRTKTEDILALYPNFEHDFARTTRHAFEREQASMVAIESWTNVMENMGMKKQQHERPPIFTAQSDPLNAVFPKNEVFDSKSSHDQIDPTHWIDDVVQNRSSRVCIEEAREPRDVMLSTEFEASSFLLDGSNGCPTSLHLWIDRQSYRPRLAWYGPSNPGQKYPSWKTFVLSIEPSIRLLLAPSARAHTERLIRWSTQDKNAPKLSQKFVFQRSEDAQQFSDQLAAATHQLYVVIRGEKPSSIPYLQDAISEEKILFWSKSVVIRHSSDPSPEIDSFQLVVVSHSIPRFASRIIVLDKGGNNVMRIMFAHRFPTTTAQFRYHRLIHRPGKYIKLSVLKSDNQQGDAVIHWMVDGGPAFSTKNFNGSNIMFGEWSDDQDEIKFLETLQSLGIEQFVFPSWHNYIHKRRFRAVGNVSQRAKDQK